MKKIMAFILILTLILSTFSFAFAENTEEVALKLTSFEKDLTESTVVYDGSEWQGVRVSDYDFIIIKQADDNIYIWTPETISYKEELWDQIVDWSIDGKGDKSFIKGNDDKAVAKATFSDLIFINGKSEIKDKDNNVIYYFDVTAAEVTTNASGEAINTDFGPAILAKAEKVGHFDGGNYRLGEDVTIELVKSVVATGTALKGTVDLSFKAEGLDDTVILENDTFIVNNFKFADEVTTKTFDGWQIRVNKLPCELKITEYQGGEDGIVGNSDFDWTNDSTVYYIEFDADRNVTYYTDEEMTTTIDEVAFTNNVATSRYYDIPYSFMKTVDLTKKGSAKFENNFEFSVVLTDKNSNVITTTTEGQYFKNASTKTINNVFEKIAESSFPCTVTIQETIGGGSAAGWTDDTNSYSMIYDIERVTGDNAVRTGDIVANNDITTTTEAIEFVNIYDNTSPKYDFAVDFKNTVKAVSEAALAGTQNFEFSVFVKDSSGNVVDNTTKTEKVSKPGSEVINYKSDKYLVDAFPFTIEITETAGGSSPDGLQYWDNDTDRTIIVTAAISGSSIVYSVTNGDELEFINTYGENDKQSVDDENDIENPVVGPTDPTVPSDPADSNNGNDKEVKNTEINNAGVPVKSSSIDVTSINGYNIPLAGQSDLIIPEAEMPQTGGLGIPLFYLLGGAIAAIGIFSLIFFSLLGRERNIAKIFTGRREG